MASGIIFVFPKKLRKPEVLDKNFLAPYPSYLQTDMFFYKQKWILTVPVNENCQQ